MPATAPVSRSGRLLDLLDRLEEGHLVDIYQLAGIDGTPGADRGRLHHEPVRGDQVAGECRDAEAQEVTDSLTDTTSNQLRGQHHLVGQGPSRDTRKPRK